MKCIELVGRVEMKTVDVVLNVREDWECIGTYTFFPYLEIGTREWLVRQKLKEYFVRIERVAPDSECGYLVDCVKGVYHIHIYFKGIPKGELTKEGRLCWDWGYYAVSTPTGQILYPKRG